jgi:hypothetical protein
VRPENIDDRGPAAIDPTGPWRLLFWLLWVSGTAVLLISWGLLLVPHRADAGDLLVRFSAAALLLFAVLISTWIWRTDQRTKMRAFMAVVWVELALALIEAAGTAVFLASGR